MNRNNLSLGALPLVFLLLALASCAPASSLSSSAGGLPPEIPVTEAFAKREAGAFILDVRQPEEWNEFHIPGSALVPLEKLEQRLNELPRDKEIVVVCRSGNRSRSGRDILEKAGFMQVTSMAGGLTDWKARGYPTVSGP